MLYKWYVYICIYVYTYTQIYLLIYISVCMAYGLFICLFIAWAAWLALYLMWNSLLEQIGTYSLLAGKKNAAKVSETKKNEAFHHKDGCVKNRKGSVAFTKSRWHSLRASMRQASSLNLLRRTVVKTSFKKIIMYHCLEKR